MENTDSSYITFIEPNEKFYEIFFRKDGTEYVAMLVPRDNTNEDPQNFFGPVITQLLSFVGPDQKSYRINRQDVNGEKVPLLGMFLKRNGKDLKR